MKIFICSVLYIQRPIKTATIENKCPPPAQTHTHTSVTEGRRHSTLHSWYYSGFDSGLWAPRHWYFNIYRGNIYSYNTGLKSVMEATAWKSELLKREWSTGRARRTDAPRSVASLCSLWAGEPTKSEVGRIHLDPTAGLLMREEHCSTAKNLLRDMSPLK